MRRMKMNIISFFYKYGWKIAKIVLIPIVCLAPFVTEYIIKNGWYRPDSFTNEVWFSFMGSYLGAIVTLLVMYLTFMKTNDDRKKEMRFQLKKQTIEIQKENIRRLCDILLLTNYPMVSRDCVIEDIAKYSSDIQTVGITVLFVKYDEYETRERTNLVDTLLSLFLEQKQLLEEYQEKATHVEGESDAKKRINESIIYGYEVRKLVNRDKAKIYGLLDAYLRSVEKSIYDGF